MGVPNIAVATPGVVLLPLHVTEVAATTAKLASWKLPFGAKVLGVSVTARPAAAPGRR